MQIDKNTRMFKQWLTWSCWGRSQYLSYHCLCNNLFISTTIYLILGNVQPSRHDSDSMADVNTMFCRVKDHKCPTMLTEQPGAYFWCAYACPKDRWHTASLTYPLVHPYSNISLHSYLQMYMLTSLLLRYILYVPVLPTDGRTKGLKSLLPTGTQPIDSVLLHPTGFPSARIICW